MERATTIDPYRTPANVGQLDQIERLLAAFMYLDPPGAEPFRRSVDRRNRGTGFTVATADAAITVLTLEVAQRRREARS